MMRLFAAILAAACLLAVVVTRDPQRSVHAQATPSPTLLDSNLAVRTVVGGLSQPTTMAFLGPNRFLILEKASGRVKLVVNGTVEKTVLDLAVNSASERGLLGIALHPGFPANRGVYLYWTCTAPAPPASDPYEPSELECPDTPAAGADSTNLLAVPLRGNRVDRFLWDPAAQTLTFDRNLIKLRSFQNEGAPTPPGQGDSAQAVAGNHDGGVIKFGPDRKLYIVIGDNGRRGRLQNLVNGPTPPTPDDQFGGPVPDDAHLTGVVIRLNDDGSTPDDNPFVSSTSPTIRKVFAYGIRNSFGMAFDPYSGNLWLQENGDDTFDEINLVEPGMNGGWVQIAGPLSRIGEFKFIESFQFGLSLQQFRWPPTRIAETPDDARGRFFQLPGSHYSDPEFSWKFAVAPAAIGFVMGRGLGPEYEGSLIVGAARPNLLNGYLFRFGLTGNRQSLGVSDRQLRDAVADNSAKFDIRESETLLFGRDFGVGTDIVTGPNGLLYVVSLSNGAVYEISRAQ